MKSLDITNFQCWNYGHLLSDLPSNSQLAMTIFQYRNVRMQIHQTKSGWPEKQAGVGVLHRSWHLVSHTLFPNGLKLMPRGLCDHSKSKRDFTSMSYNFCISTPIMKLWKENLRKFENNSQSNSMVKINLWSGKSHIPFYVCVCVCDEGCQGM